MNYSLPKTIVIGDQEYAIRYDFRVILTVIEALNDSELSSAEKAETLITLFYVDSAGIRDYEAAIKECFDFIDMGESQKKKSPRVMDWEQDFNYIIAPINRVLGKEIREIPYDFDTNEGGLHWWSFMGAYMEIGGDCMFSQIVTIRDKQARGKKLEKYEREWLRRNSEIVNLKQKFTETEDKLLQEWMGGKNG